MLSKIIFVLATVCVINASVLPDSDADTVPDNSASNIEDSISPRKCTHQECNALCHKLKFRQGVCIAGRCNCNVFFPIPNADAVTNIEDSVSPRKCTHEQCNTLCHKLKFREGVCIAGRCSCNNYFPIPNVDAVTNLEDSVSPRKCTHEQCNTLCHKLKFREGVCIAGRCSCNNYFPIPNADAVPDNSVSNVENSVSSRKCTHEQCNTLCHKLKFREGVCIAGRCSCNNYFPIPNADAVTNVEDSVSPRKCTHEQCNTLCHKLKFREGVCIAGRCSCNNYFPIPNDADVLGESITHNTNFPSDDYLSTEDLASEETLPVSELSEDRRGCNPQACHQLCRRIKQAGGACVNGRCKCDIFLGAEDLVSEESLPVSELSEDPTKRGCNPQACHQLCRRIKRSGGACVDGRCKCDIFLGAEDAVDEYSELNRKRCRITKCNRTCTRRGYEAATCVEGRCKCYNTTTTPLPVSELSEDPTKRGCNPQACHQLCRRIKRSGGACVNGRCKCDIFLGAEVSEESLPVSELSEDPTKRGCNPQACHQLCRRIKRSGGACVNGRCKCDIFLGAEGNAIDEYPEVDTRRVCSKWQCNRTCTRRGYAGARCVNGWCKCHDKIQREDAAPLNNVASDVNEESYDDLKTNEEELTPLWSLECNIFKCTEKCYHLKFDLGWCYKGRCECYKNKWMIHNIIL